MVGWLAFLTANSVFFQHSQLYFTDVATGGETVFTKAWPPNATEAERIPLDDAIQEFRKTPESKHIKNGSWEEKMVAQCRTKLRVKPYRSRAVLFYSQLPDGRQDYSSEHGGCPVLEGTKLAANLWTWSGIRPEYDGAPQRRDLTESERKKSEETVDGYKKVHATFRNSGKDPAFDEHTEVYYQEDTPFGKLGPNDDPVGVNTFKGHVWNIKNKGKTLKTYHISGEEGTIEFVV